MSRDIKLTPDGDIYPQTKYVRGREYVRQRVQIRLNRWLGENILDTREGMPFRRWLAQKPIPVDQIRDFTRREIERTDGVARVQNLEAVVVNREVKISGDIILEENSEAVRFDAYVSPSESTARVLTPQMR